MNLQITSDPSGLTSNNEDVICCEIVRFVEPSTLSCVMEVKLLNRNTRAALKLYDQRFALSLRSEYKVEPATTATEMAFTDFVKNGGALDSLDRLRNDDDYEEPEEGWNTVENETYLYDWCIDMFKAETMMYDKLKDLQGKEIPYLFAQVRLPLLGSSQDETMGSCAAENLFEVPGILLELIDGPTLSKIANIPREDWSEVCEEAVRVVRLLDDLSIRNEDVRPGNIMISRSPSEKPEKKYRIVMLDFAQCVEREPEQTDAEWGRLKWNQDEEGAIGLVMQHRLKRDHAYDWPFHHSHRFLEWAEGEDDSP